ncbi:MAG: formate dehydrogenase subunit gamma [Paracoccaceae bacterium]
MIRAIAAILLPFLLALPAASIAQAVEPPPDSIAASPQSAQSLEDILARQAGLDNERQPRDSGSADDAVAGIGAVLGTNGTVSDAAVWESLRFGSSDVTVSAGGPQARVLIQDAGMWWLDFRKGPLATYGGWLLLGMIGVLAAFYLVRGKITLSHGFSGVRIVRFKAIERFGHWLLAGSFLLLAFTGLISLFGRMGLIPLLGRDAYAMLAAWSKWVHNNVSWAFMIALVMIFVMWVVHNLPSRHDLVWFAKGGGIIGNGHPPAKKFNAGQKIIFWSVVLLGASISASGLSLLFPFQLPMFAKTFAVMNDLGLPGLVGAEAFPTRLAPHQEMQFAQLWHSIAGFVLLAIIIAHIYIGTLGMEGAHDAMGSGEVDLNWAKEHHSLWVEEVQARAAPGEMRQTTPAE